MKKNKSRVACYTVAGENLSDQVTFEQGLERNKGVIHVPIGENTLQVIKNKCKGGGQGLHSKTAGQQGGQCGQSRVKKGVWKGMRSEEQQGT